MKTTAKKAFSYIKNYAPGDDFEGTRNQVEQLAAAGNVEMPEELKDFLKEHPESGFVGFSPTEQAQKAQQASLTSQTVDQEAKEDTVKQVKGKK
jgi:hypothetical protein